METLERTETHRINLNTNHLIICRNCGEIAAEILYTEPFHKEPSPPKAESLNVAALDAAIKESIELPLPQVRGEDVQPWAEPKKPFAVDHPPAEPKTRSKTSELEKAVLAVLFMNPSASGKEVIEATGGKPSTVYNILRKTRTETGAKEQPKEQPPSPKIAPAAPVEMVDYIEWYERFCGWGSASV